LSPSARAPRERDALAQSLERLFRFIGKKFDLLPRFHNKLKLEAVKFYYMHI